MDTITGQGMVISKTKISTEGFEKVEITAEMAGIFGLPKKAIGKWAVVAEDDVERRLMKVRLDGYFASDKYNNHQKISRKILAQIFGGEHSAKFEFFKLSVRKRKWVMSLIDEFYKDRELSRVLEELGHNEVILRILDDTSADRAGGKLYSSIESAIAYWMRNYGRNEE